MATIADLYSTGAVAAAIARHRVAAVYLAIALDQPNSLEKGCPGFTPQQPLHAIHDRDMSGDLMTVTP